MRRTAKFLTTLVVTALVFLWVSPAIGAGTLPFKLGNEVLYTRYHHVIEGKRVGLVTNQSGVNSEGISTIDVLAADSAISLVALFGPEHGIDGQASAGARVDSYQHPVLNIPVYSLYGYGDQRKPSEAMLKDLDVLIFDIQDIGARTYTYISTLNYVIEAAAKYSKPVIVLDRPNPLGGEIVEAPVLEDSFKTFVGVDNLPMAHGMTVGELAKFFNRVFEADLTVIPMEGYMRDTIWQDTGLPWISTSPNIPDIESVFGYMATGLGEGTGIRQLDKFKWIGGKGIDSNRFAELLNESGIQGVKYIPDPRGSEGGVKLQITDFRTFNPAKSGLYALAYAKQLTDFSVPKSLSIPDNVVMFDKIMGTDKVGQWLEQGLSPQEIEKRYAVGLEEFKHMRQQYLIYGYGSRPGTISILVDNVPIFFDTEPYIDSNNRTMVPVRAISEALGAEVGWDPVKYEVSVERGGRLVKLIIGSSKAFVNGVETTMDTEPVIKNDRTMIPVRFLGELLGDFVDWDAQNRTVIVEKKLP